MQIWRHSRGSIAETSKVLQFREQDLFLSFKKFENVNNEFLHPFHIVADFESTLEEVKDDEDNNTQKYQKHVANSFGLKYNCIHKEYSEPEKIFNSSNQKLVVKKFVETIDLKLNLK